MAFHIPFAGGRAPHGCACARVPPSCVLPRPFFCMRSDLCWCLVGCVRPGWRGAPSPSCLAACPPASRLRGACGRSGTGPACHPGAGRLPLWDSFASAFRCSRPRVCWCGVVLMFGAASGRGVKEALHEGARWGCPRLSTNGRQKVCFHRSTYRQSPPLRRRSTYPHSYRRLRCARRARCSPISCA